MTRYRWTPVDRGCRENPGHWDSGHGSTIHRDQCAALPDVERRRETSYCGRSVTVPRIYLDIRTGDEFRAVAALLRARREGVAS